MQFRKTAYGKNGIRDLLRDVLAMANAALVGPRYIVTGLEVSADGSRRLRGVAAADFEGRPSYHAVVDEFIEPPIRIRYEPVTVDGVTVGVFEIGHCHDRPYMMRIDHSETLRRGDAYARVDDTAFKLRRRQLQALFEEKRVVRDYSKHDAQFLYGDAAQNRRRDGARRPQARRAVQAVCAEPAGTRRGKTAPAGRPVLEPRCRRRPDISPPTSRRAARYSARTA